LESIYEIVLVRVDERLIHGQILEAWVPFLKAACIIVANDGVAADFFRETVMRMAVPSETELFNMLDMGRIDVALYDRLTGLEQISLRNFKGMFYLEPPLASRNMYLYLNRKHAKLAEPLAEALRSMKKDGTYDGIVNDATSHLMK